MKKLLIFFLTGLLLIAMIGITGCTSKPNTPDALVATPLSTVKVGAPVATVKENTDKTTLGEINAALKAKQYLRSMAFSRKGLIEQLEFEGFTPQQAEYGVQAVGY